MEPRRCGCRRIPCRRTRARVIKGGNITKHTAPKTSRIDQLVRGVTAININDASPATAATPVDDDPLGGVGCHRNDASQEFKDVTSEVIRANDHEYADAQSLVNARLTFQRKLKSFVISTRTQPKQVSDLMYGLSNMQLSLPVTTRADVEQHQHYFSSSYLDMANQKAQEVGSVLVDDGLQMGP